MISCNSTFEQGNLDLWRYINAFINIIRSIVGRECLHQNIAVQVIVYNSTTDISNLTRGIYLNKLFYYPQFLLLVIVCVYFKTSHNSQWCDGSY